MLSYDKQLEVCTDLEQMHLSLKGIGALFEQQKTDIIFCTDDLAGIGQCLKMISSKISNIEDVLRENLPQKKD